jgi:hypothetical protein
MKAMLDLIDATASKNIIGRCLKAPADHGMNSNIEKVQKR